MYEGILRVLPGGGSVEIGSALRIRDTGGIDRGCRRLNGRSLARLCDGMQYGKVQIR